MSSREVMIEMHQFNSPPHEGTLAVVECVMLQRFPFKVMEMLTDAVCIRTYINYKQTRLKILVRGGTPSMNAQEISDNNIARSISLASEEEEEKVLCVLV